MMSLYNVLDDSPMDKYLFLDFDGVLNTEFYQDLLMSQGSPYRDKHGLFFDPVAVEQLKRVIDSTHADIIIILEVPLAGGDAGHVGGSAFAGSRN